MTGATTTRWIGRLGAFLLTAGLALGVAGADPAELGRAYDVDPDGPRLLDTRGRPLANGGIVLALNHAALVRLDNGQVLKLAANSSALLEGGAGEVVQVTVLSGRAVAADEFGRPLVAGQGSRFALPPALRDVEADEARLLGFDLAGPLGRDEAGRPPGRARLEGRAGR